MQVRAFAYGSEIEPGMLSRSNTLAKRAAESFTVVIVNLNGQDTIPAAVRSVVAEGVPERNIVVIDNGSTDLSISIIRAQFPPVQTHLNSLNLGFAKAANIGMRIAKSEFVLLLNNDAELRSGCLSEFLAAFERNPRLAFAGGQLLYPDGRLQSAFAPLPSLLEEIVPRSFLRIASPDRYRRTTREADVREVQSIFGACLAIRTAALLEIGLLDEDFFFYYEEIDWCRRAQEAGWAVAFVPRARTDHLSGHTARKFGSRARIELERSKLLYFRKNFGASTYATLSVHLTARAGINAVSCSLSTLFASKQNDRLLQKARTYRDLFAWHVSGRPKHSGLPRRRD